MSGLESLFSRVVVPAVAVVPDDAAVDGHNVVIADDEGSRFVLPSTGRRVGRVPLVHVGLQHLILVILKALIRCCRMLSGNCKLHINSIK